MTDVVIVGCGGGGAVLAYEVAAAGLDVVALEAGVWHDPAKDFSALEWSMFNQITGVFRWGPADPTLPPWPSEAVNMPVRLQTAGVGGNTLHYVGNSPRAYPESMRDWPVSYDELMPYYERVETLLPVLEPKDIYRRDELFIAGCEKLGWAHTPGRTVTSVGWRLQPNAVSHDCTNCGHCLIGCEQPAGGPRGTAKRGTNASYAPMAVATGRCEIRTECFATRILTETVNGKPRAKGIRYRRANGAVEEIEAKVVVLAGGTFETPRLWLNSGLPTDTPVGRYFTLHWPDFLVGVVDEETENHKGNQCMTRCEFPGYGFIEALGSLPMNFSLINFSGTGFGSHGVSPDDPWKTKGQLWGSDLKRRMQRYNRSLVICVFTDDEELPESRVELAQRSDDHGRIPRVTYVASPKTVQRREFLAQRAAEVLLAAGCDPESIHRSDAPPNTIHQHGTMRMGTDPATSVVDAAGEAHRVAGLFVADCSILPNGIGGPNPTLTCQALATRTAEHLVRRHFS